MYVQYYEIAQAQNPLTTGRSFSPVTAGILAVAVLLVGRWLIGTIQLIKLRGSETRKGRWVRDRGLGGKLVRPMSPPSATSPE